MANQITIEELVIAKKVVDNYPNCGVDVEFSDDQLAVFELLQKNAKAKVKTNKNSDLSEEFTALINMIPDDLKGEMIPIVVQAMDQIKKGRLGRKLRAMFAGVSVQSASKATSKAVISGTASVLDAISDIRDGAKDGNIESALGDSWKRLTGKKEKSDIISDILTKKGKK
jgi:hypothetical protein